MSQARAAKEAMDNAVIAYKCSKSSVLNNIAKKDTVSERTFLWYVFIYLCTYYINILIF